MFFFGDESGSNRISPHWPRASLVAPRMQFTQKDFRLKELNQIILYIFVFRVDRDGLRRPRILGDYRA